MAAQLKPDGGRSRLVSQSHFEQARTRPCIGTQSRGRTSQSSVRAAASPREAVASSPRARAMLQLHLGTLPRDDRRAGLVEGHEVA